MHPSTSELEWWLMMIIYIYHNCRVYVYIHILSNYVYIMITIIIIIITTIIIIIIVLLRTRRMIPRSYLSLCYPTSYHPWVHHPSSLPPRRQRLPWRSRIRSSPTSSNSCTKRGETWEVVQTFAIRMYIYMYIMYIKNNYIILCLYTAHIRVYIYAYICCM